MYLYKVLGFCESGFSDDSDGDDCNGSGHNEDGKGCVIIADVYIVFVNLHFSVLQ